MWAAERGRHADLKVPSQACRHRRALAVLLVCAVPTVAWSQEDGDLRLDNGAIDGDGLLEIHAEGSAAAMVRANASTGIGALGSSPSAANAPRSEGDCWDDAPAGAKVSCVGPADESLRRHFIWSRTNQDYYVTEESVLEVWTLDITAEAGADYTAVARTMTLPAGKPDVTISWPVTDDDLDEPEETFALQWRHVRGPIKPSPDAYDYIVYIISDNDPPAVLAAQAAAAREDDFVVAFPVSLDPASGHRVTVDYATADGTAVAGQDYTAVSGTLTFEPDARRATIRVPVLVDEIAEDDEEFALNLSGPANATLHESGRSATGTILAFDQTQSTALQVADAPAVDEAGPVLSFPVRVSGAHSSTVEVDFATADGTANAGSDYVAKSGTLTFPVGTRSLSVAVDVVDDAVDEPAETVSLELSNPSAGATIRDAQGTAVIRDDDPPTSVSVADATGTEGGTADFDVTLAEATGQTVTVSFWTTSGTAEAELDFDATVGRLTFPPGTTTRVAAVPLLDDTLDEVEEDFELHLWAPANATLGTSSATGSVVDNDPPPSLSIGDGMAGESGVVEFSVELATASSFEVSVDYATVDGTALAGLDYEGRSGRLSFAPGDTERTIRVRTLQDSLYEGDETFTVRLTNPENATVANPSATGVVVEDDVPRISVRDATGVEGATLEFEVRAGGASPHELTVDYATADITAKAGEDYQSASGTLTIPPLTMTRTITVDLLEDDLDEGVLDVLGRLVDETLSLSLSNPSFATAVLSGATGTIEDNDAPSRVVVEDAAGDEGDAATFTIRLEPVSGRYIEVDYATADGTARAGSDYQRVEDFAIFPAGKTVYTVAVEILQDDVFEGEEAFELSITDALGAAVGEHSTGTGTIVDDDDPPAVSVADGRGGEGGAADFVVGLVGATALETSVSYKTSDDTATAEEDYAAAQGELTFAPGVTAKTLSVPLRQDGLDEEDEEFGMALSQPVNAVLSRDVATGTIEDVDDPPSINVSDSAGVEGSVAEFEVWLDAVSGRSVTVDYATTDQTALAGSDYESVSGTLTFAPGTAAVTVQVPLAQDTLDEESETFTLALSGAVHATIGSAGVGTIVDDDGEPEILPSSASAMEGGMLAFGLRLAGSSSRNITVEYETRDGTATAGDDYEATSGVLTFEPGQSNLTVRVQLIEDTVKEPDEELTLALSSPQNATLAKDVAAGTIVDDDPSPSLSLADAAGVEGDTLAFVVTLSGETAMVVSVSYQTSDGSASTPMDYKAADGVLTFEPGEMSATVLVALPDDLLHEPSETFRLSLSLPTNATIGVGAATGTIRDDDPSPSLSVADAEGSEGGVARFSVTLVGATSLTATVEYSTEDGTAIAGQDYRATTGVLTFAPGTSVQVVSVALVDDDVEDPGESFALRLAAPVNAMLARAKADGSIEDDDQMATLSVTGGRGVEGETFKFVVTLAGSTTRTVYVDYATVDGTAVAGEDYAAVSGTATFTSGEREMTVAVMLLNDDQFEPEEYFDLQLSAPANATVAVGVATATILDGTRARKASTKGHVLLFEPADHAHRQGFVRVINHSDEAGEVSVEAIDGSGMRVGPVTLAVGAGTATHFNSDDLEEGNAQKGLPDGVGPAGEGAWRLELSSELDIEVLSYARTADGFVTSLHDTAPDSVGVHRAVFVNPGRNADQVSRLRLVNPGLEDARVTIAGTDDLGMTAADVVVEVPAGTAREWTAAELESGIGTQGALGMGDGKWRLRLSSDWPVVVLSLIENPPGHLTNLSTLPRPPEQPGRSHWVRLFPSASDALGRQGFVRVVNGTEASAEVTIEAVDTTDWQYPALTLTVGAGEVASFNSDDLEMGNETKGLAGSTGAGQGDWMLELTSRAEIEVFAYIRTTDGFVTAMHDVVPEEEGTHRVVFFNPASNANQVSVLRIINTGDQDALATIEGVDDSGATPGTPVHVTLATGRSLELTSRELETGQSAAITGGALGDGWGKWRLDITSDQPLVVMSLLSNPTGHLTNLSTAIDRGVVQDMPVSPQHR